MLTYLEEKLPFIRMKKVKRKLSKKQKAFKKFLKTLARLAVVKNWKDLFYG